MVVVASFSDVCVFSENDPSRRQRYHFTITFSNLSTLDTVFQKISFLLKTVIVFDRFRVVAR